MAAFRRLRKWRSPRFSLLLSGLVAAVAVAIVALGGGGQRGGRTPGKPPPAVSSGRVRVCITTQAVARATAPGVVTATGTATVSIRVSQTVVGPIAAVTVTRGGSFTGRVKTSRHLSVTERSVARARHCAAGRSLAAARGQALRQAYAIARTRARKGASAGAAHNLSSLEHRVYPRLQTEAQSAARRRAQAMALAARPALIRAARRQALRRAG